MLSPQTEHPVANTRTAANPLRIFETLNRYQHTMALKGAIDLDLFTQIAAGAATPPVLAAKCHASERGVRILCDFLVILGFLTKADGSYDLTPDSALFLNRNSPAYLGTIANFLTRPEALDNFRDVPALVRKGGTLDGAGSMKPAPLASISAQLLLRLSASLDAK